MSEMELIISACLCRAIPPVQVVYVGFLGYYTPLFVMLGAYARILLVVRKRAASIRDAGRKVRV